VRPPAPSRDLAQVIDQNIAWQETGSSPDRAMSLPAVAAVVRLISSTIDQRELVVDNGVLPEWLRRPRLYESALDLGDLIQHVTTSMALAGAGYLQVERVGESWTINALHHSSVQPLVSSGGIVSITYRVDGKPMPVVPARQERWQSGPYLLPVPYMVTPHHPEGSTPLMDAWPSISGYLKVASPAANLLDSGTYSGGRLETDHDITPESARRYRDAWVEARRSNRIPVLGNGIRYVNDIISPKDAAWIESRLANAQAVASMFGMPPDMLGMTMAGGGSSLSYQNSQDNNRRLRANCLEGFTSQIEDALSPLLMRPGRNGEEERGLRFDYSEWEATANADTQPEA